MVRREVLIGTALLLVVPLLFGCGIPQEDYEATVAEKDAAQSQVASLQSDLAAAQSDLEVAESATASAENQLSSLKSQVAALQKELSEKESTLPIITNDMWTLSGNVWILGSQGISKDFNDNICSFDGALSGVGSGISYVYSRLSFHWASLQKANTIIVFVASAEQLSILADWPEPYIELCPFTVNELSSINLPFALFKRQDDGLIRAIIIGNSEQEVVSLITIMNGKQVPVNVPWTLSPGEIVACQTGGGWYEEPKVISDANISVQYPEGYETDASNMLAWANQVVTILQKWFPDFLNVIGSRIIIEIKDTGDPSHASADIGRTSIKFVAPSVAAKASSYYDTDWYTGNIAHELGHIVLDKYRKLAGGYLRSDLPRWFDEGFGEYLRLLVIGEQRFNENYSRYSSEIPNILANGTSGITDVYAGGAWVLRFIDSKFGIDTIKAIITSKQPTFWAAVTEQINLTRAQFDEQLKEWLKERIKD